MTHLNTTHGRQSAIYDSFRRSNLRARRRNTFFKTLCIAIGFACSILLGFGAGQLAALVQLPVEHRIELDSER